MGSEAMKRPRVGVLMGGWSAEGEVSLRMGEAVAVALEGRGHDVVRVVWVCGERGLDELLREAQIDVAFIALHGRAAEDGCVQGMLELMGIPYTGSGVLASALAMDKLKAKEMFRLHNVPTPPYYLATRADLADVESLHGAFGFPVTVKPRRGASSVGLAQATSLAELREAIQRAFAYGDAVLVERYVRAMAVHVGIVHDRVLGVIDTDYACPPLLPPTRLNGVMNLGLRAARALSCSGACVVGLLVTEGENEYVLEVGTRPTMMPTSLLPTIAAKAGLDYASLCESLLEGAALLSTAA
jgi:D-alanine-D-alanine ligase